MKLISKKYSALVWAVGLTLLSGPAVSKSFFVHNGPAEEGQGFEDGFSYISLDGKVTMDPLRNHQQTVEMYPEFLDVMPADISLITLKIRAFYTAPSGDTSDFEIEMPVASPRHHSEEFAKGYYQRISEVYSWPKIGNERNSVSTSPGARIIVANNHKIPVYMHAGALNEPFFEPVGPPSHRYHDFFRLSDRFRDGRYVNDVGALATNANANINNNYGCSGWYQFRFYGYLDYDWLEDGISKEGDMARLPPGITLVPRITYCGGKEDDIMGFPGCATLNGTKIALEASIFTDPAQPEAVIMLHEIGHTKGLDHPDMDADNIMTSPSRSDTTEIKREQCPKFSIGKQYVSPDPWEE